MWNGKRLNPEQNGWHSLPGQIVGLDTPNGQGWYGWDGFSARLFHIRSYCDTYIEHYKNALAGPLSASALLASVDAWAPKLAAGAAADFKRWDRPLNYQEEVDYLKFSILKRHEHMLQEIEGACDRGTNFINEPLSPRLPFSAAHP